MSCTFSFKGQINYGNRNHKHSVKVYKALPGGSGIILFSFEPIKIKKGLFEFFVCFIRFPVTKLNKTREFNLFHGSIFSSDRKTKSILSL